MFEFLDDLNPFAGLEAPAGVGEAAAGAFPWGALASVAGPIFGGILGYEGQVQTNSANAQQAQAQMDFQERMSNTSYQRAVKDLAAAGLNPMLAYSRGGASTPGGAMAAMGNAAEAGVSGAVRAAQVAPQLELLRSQVDNTKADTALKSSQALVNAAQVPNYHALTRQALGTASQVEQLARRLLEENELGYSLASYWHRRNQAYREGEEADIASQRRHGGFTSAQIEEMLARARQARSQSVLNELAEPRARNLANAQSDWWMQGISPYLDDVAKIANSAGDLSRLIPWHRMVPFRFR